MQMMFGVVKSRISGILFQTLSQQNTDSSQLQRGFGQTLVGKISAFTRRCCRSCLCSFSHVQTPIAVIWAELCLCREVSPCTGIRELRCGVRMCLPELITLVFYTLPYLQLQREQRRHLGCFQRPLPAGLSPGPTRGCFSAIYKLFQGWNHFVFRRQLPHKMWFKCSLPAGFCLAGFAAAAPSTFPFPGLHFHHSPQLGIPTAGSIRPSALKMIFLGDV